MSEVVQLTVPIPPYALGLNGSRINFHKRVAVKQAYQAEVYIALASVGVPKGAGCPWPASVVEYDWHSCQRLDLDNIVIRMKYALDVLRGRIIVDDSGVQELTARWHKAATKKDECVIVTVHHLPDVTKKVAP